MNRQSPFASRAGLGALAISAFAGLAFTPMVRAADWSDTALSLRYGTTFAEPFDNDADGSRTDIKKAILALTNVTGYKYGTTFINIDFLQSDSKDPGGGIAGHTGAQEVYGVFRNTFDIGKISGAKLAMGPVRGYGLTAGIDVKLVQDLLGHSTSSFTRDTYQGVADEARRAAATTLAKLLGRDGTRKQGEAA